MSLFSDIYHVSMCWGVPETGIKSIWQWAMSTLIYFWYLYSSGSPYKPEHPVAARIVLHKGRQAAWGVVRTYPNGINPQKSESLQVVSTPAWVTGGGEQSALQFLPTGAFLLACYYQSRIKSSWIQKIQDRKEICFRLERRQSRPKELAFYFDSFCHLK